MALSEAELTQPACSLYVVSIIGGDAVFLVDRRIGHKLYMGLGRPISRSEVRSHVLALNYDLKNLSTADFLAKHGLSG